MKSVYGVALATLLAFTPSLSHADQISVAGGDSYTATDIDFTGPFIATGGTGVFAPLNGGSVNFPTPVLPYAAQGPVPTTAVFTLTGGGVTDTFYVDSVTSTTVNYATVAGAQSAVLIDATGYYTGTNFTGQDLGSFVITTQGESSSGSLSDQVTFSATGSTAVTPEPASLILMASGLLIGAAVLIHNRRETSEIW